jgi:hypothetical protein
VTMTIEVIFFKISNLLVEWSDQLIFLGSTAGFATQVSEFRSRFRLRHTR